MQEAYVKLMARLQRYAIAIIDADKAERERRQFTYDGKAGTITCLPIPSEPTGRLPFEDGSRLEFLNLPRSLEDSMAEISIFWQYTRWEPQGTPTTWLEIYALFKLWGGGRH